LFEIETELVTFVLTLYNSGLQVCDVNCLNTWSRCHNL